MFEVPPIVAQLPIFGIEFQPANESLSNRICKRRGRDQAVLILVFNRKEKLLQGGGTIITIKRQREVHVGFD